MRKQTYHCSFNLQFLSLRNLQIVNLKLDTNLSILIRSKGEEMELMDHGRVSLSHPENLLQCTKTLSWYGEFTSGNVSNSSIRKVDG